MCGIIAYTGSKKIRDILLTGLQRLEYRGYDSAGIAIQNGSIDVIKTEGSVEKLRKKTPIKIEGSAGIAHTRWATHGPPTEINSHPHRSASGNLVMVHNGIIENTEELKEQFKDVIGELKSETDSEVLLNIIDHFYQPGKNNLHQAIKKTLKHCIGSYALVLMSEKMPGELILCKKGSPVVIGKDTTGSYIASDIYALSEYTERFWFPEEGDIVFLNNKGIKKAYDSNGIEKNLEEKNYVAEFADNSMGNYSHFMQKEIFEQALITKKIVEAGINIKSNKLSKEKIDELLAKVERITILACGTSWHAGLVARYLLEKNTRIPVCCEYASEYRYRNPVITPSELVISVSQSGETADTIAANRLAKESGAICMGIMNVENSSLERETDLQIFLNAGVEVGVASTKAYTSQLTVFSMFTSYICKLRGFDTTSKAIDEALLGLSKALDKGLRLASKIKKLSSKYSNTNNFLYLGRGINYPTALEGALKLKEISYIHAEGYPGAEMKHGPLALIDDNFPTLAIVTDSENRAKMISNIREVKARSGRIIAICTEEDTVTPSIADDVIILPKMNDLLTPVVSIVVLQLFSYYISVLRGCNVDKPRNLAKSVTVE